MSSLTLFTVLIDEMPLTTKTYEISDYSAWEIFSLSAFPLTKLTNYKAQPLAASSWKKNEESTFFRFTIKENLFWSNGDNLQAKDFIRSFKKLLKSKNRFSNLLSDIKTQKDEVLINSEKNSLIIELQNSNIFFPEILSLLPLSPLHSEDENLSAGAYYLKSFDNQSLTMSLNPYFPKPDNEFVSNLIFLNCKLMPKFGIPDVLNGKYDMSCGTAFPYNYFSKLKDNLEVKSQQMVMLLSLGSLHREYDSETYHNIHLSLDLTSISKKLHNVLNPIRSYYDLFESPTPYKKNLKQFKAPKKLIFAYEDYFPNKEILNQIINQLKPSSANWEIVPEKYGSRSADCHLRFEIRQSPLAMPYLFLQSEISTLKSSILKDEALSLFRKYKKTGSDEIFLKLKNILAKEKSIFPLFEVPSIRLRSRRCDSKNLFEPGNIWRLSKC